MSASGVTIGNEAKAADATTMRINSLVIAAVILNVFAWTSPVGVLQSGLAAASVTLALVTVAIGLNARHARLKQTAANEVISDFIEQDFAPSIIACQDGEIVRVNRAARSILPDDGSATIAAILKTTFANPGGIIQRLQSEAEAGGASREDIVTRKGHVRLSVHTMGHGSYLWRLETISNGAVRSSSETPTLPMLMVGRTGAVLYMNDAARNYIGQRVTSLDRLFVHMPPQPGQVEKITTKNGEERALVAELPAGAGRRAIYLLPDPEVGEREALSAVDDLPVPLLEIDENGVITDFNSSARSLVGEALEHGVALIDVLEGLGRPIPNWIAETLANRAVQHTEFLRLKHQEKETFVQVALKRLDNGDEKRLIAVLTDATELKTLEAQFVQSQKMQAIGQLAGGVAHDFNNLLTAISGHCDLLLLRHDSGDTDFADLMQINQNVNRAASLVGQLLAFSRKQTLRAERLDLRETLSDLTHLLNRLVGEKVTLTLSHDPVLAQIRADKRQLEQVLLNLIVNARDAMPSGGEVRVETERLTLERPLLRDRANVPEGEYVCLRVVDQGIGIPKDKLQKVFEPFFTTKRAGEGTGLGLSTAYGIVKQTGGYIFVDSEVGSGTCFTLMFPVFEEGVAPLAKKEVPKVAAEQKQGDGVILLVEDEAPVRAFASRALRLRGYTVLEADSAESALRTLEDVDLSVDLFVTDVVMPGRDGPSWVREALEERPDVRVIFVSGYAEDKLSSNRSQIPNSVFLPKPFSLNDLADTVHRQLH